MGPDVFSGATRIDLVYADDVAAASARGNAHLAVAASVRNARPVAEMIGWDGLALGICESFEFVVFWRVPYAHL